MASSSFNMVDELEKAFQNSLLLVTSQEHFNTENDPEEIKSSIEQSTQKLIDAARQLDTFFIQRRMVLCSSKADQGPPKEDLEDLRLELQRKEVLIQKHWEKLQTWQNLFKNNSTGQGVPTGAAPSSGQIQAPQPGVQPQQPVPPGPMQQGSFGPGMAPATGGQPPGTYSQGGPLAYLEQTTSSIGLPRIN